MFVLLAHLLNFVLRLIDLIFKTVDGYLLTAVVFQRIGRELPNNELAIAQLTNGPSLHVTLTVGLKIPTLFEAVLAVGEAAEVTVRLGKVRLFLPHAVARVAPARILEILLVDWVCSGKNVVFVVKHELPETNLERSTGFQKHVSFVVCILMAKFGWLSRRIIHTNRKCTFKVVGVCYKLSQIHCQILLLLVLTDDAHP